MAETELPHEGQHHGEEPAKGQNVRGHSEKTALDLMAVPEGVRVCVCLQLGEQA